jgi:Flp pilus assembly pilin Flp
LQLINDFLSNLLIRVQTLREEKHEEGQTLVEYALIIALVSILLVAALGTLQGGIADVFSDIATTLTGVGGGS